MESVLQEKYFITLIAIGVLIMLAFALAFILFVNYSQKKILKEQMQVQKLALQHQEELLHSTILTQEAERKRIAQDLHDDIGSKLNVIFLNTHRLKAPNKSTEEVQSITQEVESLINTTIDSIRFISHELLPPTLEEFGLVEAIKELQFGFRKLGSIRIDFNQIDNQNTIDHPLIELSLFRVIQELLSNSMKHGEATEVNIKLWVLHDAIKLIYQDNGVGFDSAKVKVKRGLGMKNIESRLQMIKANHVYDSSIGKGTKITIELKRNEEISKH